MANHSNIDPTIGNFYHYYIVLDKLFQLKEDEKLIIEIEGDLTKVRISDNIFLENLEIKHHKAENTLNASNIDFWKTINNWVSNYLSYSDETELVLYTTSIVNTDFSSFENKSKQEKLNLLMSLKDETSNQEIIKLYKNIFKNKTNLKNILHKIKLDTENKKYDEIIDSILLKHHNYFDAFLDNKEIKVNAIKFFIGEIVYALKDKNNWELSFDYFRHIKKEFQDKNKIENPIIEESDIRDILEENKCYLNDIKKRPLYIQKLKDISFTDKQLRFASRHKLRAFKFTNKLRENSFHYYEERIKKCNISFTEKLEEIHANYTFTTNKVKNIENSQELYREAINTESLCFHDEDRTESFKKGYWHILADDEKENIFWLIKDSDNEYS